jgi:hypothetical protein
MTKVSWPAWFYGPNNQAEIFTAESQVPAGWQDHPSKVTEKPKPAPAPAAATKANPGDNQGGGTGDATGVLDADGWPFDPNMHAATQSKTKAGLWRMKVGVSRPAPKPGFPAAPLDL